ncbi:sugar efflux transporter [Gallibacterium salpingitidis]|uniref:sugar efflux transporter n=1 Tax=Gallibacterium salpingitidis TaxID=505341 RepID=UPI0026708A46|nr:sugar efflux transporter [Gallibacterium salpingitidis]WKS99695.1 sugar efflux transporter [Gallibacterium salpingitidis]
MTPEQTTLTKESSSRSLKRVTFAFLFMAFLTGIGSAFQLPVMSLFLAKEVQVSSFAVGTFFAVNALVGIVLGQIIGYFSDRLTDRRWLILLCCIMAAGGYVIFAYSRNYWVLLTLAVTLFGLGSSSNPQIFAFAREYANRKQRQAVMFMSIMRAQISLAWIIGPPLAFWLAINKGFTFLFLIGAATFLLSGVCGRCLLPDLGENKKTVKTAMTPATPQQNKISVIYLSAALVIIFSCNSMYLINMPLYITTQLHLPENLAGFLMGTAAGLEIPVMLIAGWLSKFVAKKTLMFIALICGVLFYPLLLIVSSTWGLLSLQILNAILIGIVASIGMTYFQDLMPAQLGSATTLFTNSAKSSWIIGGPLAGLIGGIYSYYDTFYFCSVLILLALFCLWKVKSV